MNQIRIFYFNVRIFDHANIANVIPIVFDPKFGGEMEVLPIIKDKQKLFSPNVRGAPIDHLGIVTSVDFLNFEGLVIE